MNITLSQEQQDFISQAVAGNNILVDACIGSGKTTSIQQLCDRFPLNKKILYLTYNKLLKIDAIQKITRPYCTVTNYHGFAYAALAQINISSGVSDLIQNFNKHKPDVSGYNVIIIDEYQDVDQEISEMLEHIKLCCPAAQIIAVGDLEQKIYDKTTLNAAAFINKYLGTYIKINFTKCFRLSADHAAFLGRIWNKNITGVNPDCKIDYMSQRGIVSFLSQQDPQNILCLGARDGDLTYVLNKLEIKYPDKFNKNTVYASIRGSEGFAAPKNTSAIFTTFDSSKGLERPICVIFDFSEEYWQSRVSKPQVDYKILRNIFCVAASRGKQRIIFVTNNRRTMLSEETLSRSTKSNTDFKDMDIGEMFDFKYKEDIEKCFKLLKVTKTKKPGAAIQIKDSDGLIDLSPCIGVYQGAMFFDKYDIDKDIELRLHTDDQSLDKDALSNKLKQYDNFSIDKKILLLTSLNTKQNRYLEQVDCPFVSGGDRDKIFRRLKSVFSPNHQEVQVGCQMDFVGFSAKGFADAVKDDIVYELKFVSEITHEHFLQCAVYMTVLDKDQGILWNLRDNSRYEIQILNRELFIKRVFDTITKRALSPKAGVA